MWADTIHSNSPSYENQSQRRKLYKNLKGSSVDLIYLAALLQLQMFVCVYSNAVSNLLVFIVYLLYRVSYARFCCMLLKGTRKVA